MKNRTIYEQCIWNQDHVEAIYPSIQGLLINDNEWHDFPPTGKGFAQYRISQEGYFQVVIAKTANNLVEKLKRMSPPATKDDAEWTIWPGKDGYLLSSVFTATPGPFNDTSETSEWLYRHALGFVSYPKGMQGVAYFSEIEAGCLLDAIERLSWLESMIISLNQAFERISNDFWLEGKNRSDEIVSTLDETFDPSEIMPVPSQKTLNTPKIREPV